MRFWRPTSIAGDSQFYREISQKAPTYYRVDRWEYFRARTAIAQPHARVLEVGCGQGYFLRSLESLGHVAIGLELNDLAAANKVTKFDVRTQMLENVAATEPASFDAVCSFQVLEHVIDPASFIDACIRVVRPGGRIILSTPNYEFPAHANCADAFDMPPHHLNHFTAQTYDRIASLMNLELIFTETQAITTPRLEVWVHDKQSPITQMIRGWLNSLLRTVAGERASVGHTLLTVLRRPIE